MGRRMLSMCLDKIVVRRDGERLIARVTGNLTGMFVLEPDLIASVGAGSPFRTLFTRTPSRLTVA